MPPKSGMYLSPGQDLLGVGRRPWRKPLSHPDPQHRACTLSGSLTRAGHLLGPRNSVLWL